MPYKNKEQQKEYMKVLMKRKREKSKTNVEATAEPIPNPNEASYPSQKIPDSPDLDPKTIFYIHLFKVRNQEREFFNWANNIRLVNRQYLNLKDEYFETKKNQLEMQSRQLRDEKNNESGN